MSQLLQALGLVSCSIFWAVYLPWAGWFIISHWYKGPRRHICLIFSSALEMPLNAMSSALFFTKKPVLCRYQSVWGQQPQKTPACCLCFSPPRKVWAISHFIFIMSSQTIHDRILTQLHGLDWPRMLRIRVRLC